jgi:hypothetical protein
MRLLFWNALFGLLAFDMLMLGRNFARLHRVVGGWDVAHKIPRPDVADRVCDAVNHACAWYPKRALCLQRSVVTTCLLRSNGVPAQMVLGAQKLPFKAHAWVEVDGHAINERTDVQTIYGIWERC